MIKKTKYSGFTLVEISIVLLVISVAVSSGLLVFNRYSEESKISQTEAKMKEIMSVIKKYALKNNKLPCPADPTQKFLSSTFGTSVAYASSRCAATGTIRTTVGGKNISMGMLPVSTLGLYPTYALDAWGNRLDYVVLDDAANTNGLNTDPGTLPLKNYSGTNYSNATLGGYDVVVILLSHGENGFGAYPGPGAAAQINPTGGVAKENNAAAGTAFNSSTRYSGFDDIDMFWTYEQIINSSLME